MRRVESVSLKVGDDYVFTPGSNYVDFEVATGNLGRGGKIRLDVDFTDVYTIESWDGDNYDATDLSAWGIIGGNTDLDQLGALSSFEGMTSDGMKYKGMPNFCYGELWQKLELNFDVDSFSNLGGYLVEDSSGTTTPLYMLEPAVLAEILTDAKTKGTDTLFWIEVIHPTNHRIHFEIKIGDIVNSGVAPREIILNEPFFNFNATELDYMIPKE